MNASHRSGLGVAVPFFFAWGFVVHGAGLVLHEVGGHGVAVSTLGCGVAGIYLTYFGEGFLYPTPCPGCPWTSLAIINWSGIAVMVGVGTAALALERRTGLVPLTRLLLALLGTWFLLGQLGYATSGGFRKIGDPGLTARALEARGLHLVAWLLPLVLFSVSALFGGRALVDAFRAHFGSRTRLHTLKQITETLGAAGALYYAALYLERMIRAGAAVHGVPPASARLAVAPSQAAPFPIEGVLVALALAAFGLALARPVSPENVVKADAPGTIPRGAATSVGAAALVCFVAITLLVRV